MISVGYPAVFPPLLYSPLIVGARGDQRAPERTAQCTNCAAGANDPSALKRKIQPHAHARGQKHSRDCDTAGGGLSIVQEKRRRSKPHRGLYVRALLRHALRLLGVVVSASKPSEEGFLCVLERDTPCSLSLQVN